MTLTPKTSPEQEHRPVDLATAVAKILDSNERQGHKRHDFAFTSGKCVCRWCEGMRALDAFRAETKA